MKLTICIALLCAIGIPGAAFAQTSELATTTTVAASSNTTYGKGVTLTATVLDSNSAAVTSGTVLFVNNVLGALTCTGVGDYALNGAGQATCTVINAANYSAYAAFQDNRADLTSTSNTVTAVISLATLSITPAGGAIKSCGQVLNLDAYEAGISTITNLQYSDAANVSYSSPGARAAAAVGNYDIVATAFTFTAGSAANYSITRNTATGGLSVTRGSCKTKAHGKRAVLWTIFQLVVL